MRILAIRGKNLASLRGDFEVALNKPPLDQVGLFAITGQTGSGKSTLLDAMCLALFDKMPRLIDSVNVKVGRSDEDEKLRISSNDVGSIVSRGTAGAYAEVDFIGLDKHTYQAHWEIKRARNKISGRLQKQSVTLTNLDTNELLGQNKSDTLDIISERIGLSFEQFRRSVLLAQGDFAAFLKAKSDQRSALLERITGTEIYSQLSIAAYRNFQQQEQLLKSIQQRIRYDLPLENQQRQDLQIIIAELGDELIVLKNNAQSSHELLKWYEIKDQLQKEQTSAGQTLLALKHEKTEKQSLNEQLEKILAIQNLRSLLQSLDVLLEKTSELVQQLEKVVEDTKSVKTNELKLMLSVKKIQEELNNSEQEYQKIKPQIQKIRELDAQIKIITEDCVAQEKVSKELSASLYQLESKKIDFDTLMTEQKAHEQDILYVTDELIKLQQQRQNISLEKLNQKKETCEQKRNELQKSSQLHHSYIATESKLKEYQEKQLEQHNNINELQQKIDNDNSEYKIIVALLDEAKRALLIMQESVTQGAQSLRSLLNDDQPCPVCGAVEHPWSEQDLVLNQQYQQQTERVKELEQSVQSSAIFISNLQQNIEYRKSEQIQQNKQLEQLSLELEQLTNQWCGSDLTQDIDIRDKQSDAQLLLEIEQLNVQIKLNKEQEKQAIDLQKKINRKQINKDHLLNKEKQLVTIISEQKILVTQVNGFQQQLDKLKSELQNRQIQFQELQNKRDQIFTGFHLKELCMNADAIDTSFTDTISLLSNQFDSEKKQLEKIKQQQIKITEQSHYLQHHIEQNKQQKQIQEKQLNSQLKIHSLQLTELRSLLQYDEQWIKQQKEDFSLLNNNLIKSETLVLERNTKLKNHREQFKIFPEALKEISRDTVSEQLKEQQQLLQKMQAAQQEKLLELKQDDEKKQRMVKIQLELDTQQQAYREWGALNDLIGSASGHKFRIFAQSLTLESLLAHANEHLNDFARRYQLQRVPGTDLELQIMDRDMADEVRSVQSLSGGESFLVSLALALGLASLSSTKTQVESLFIDEGFGTLDQETLDIAIASLDTLQGLGRKVGIISHVPILVERIGVRVLVEKMGGGQSRVVLGS